MTTRRCRGKTKKGDCTFSEWEGTGYCAPCLARSGDPRGKEEMARRYSLAMVQKAENEELARRRVTDLMSATGQVKELEAALLEAANNRGPALERVKLIREIVQLAASITKTTTTAPDTRPEDKQRIDPSRLTDEELRAYRLLKNAQTRLLGAPPVVKTAPEDHSPSNGAANGTPPATEEPAS